MSAKPNSSLAERRERLILACELDRLNLRLAMRPTATESLSVALIERIAPLIPHLPGKIGKWARNLVNGSGFVRAACGALFG